MDLSTLAVDSLAAYRLTRLVQRDTLPPLPEIRDRILDRAGDHPAAELLDCAWCGGFHAAWIVALARATAPRVWDPIARILAASAAVGLLSAFEDAGA